MMKKLFPIYLLLIIYYLLHPVAPVLAQGPESWDIIGPNKCVQEYNIDGDRIQVATIQGFECIFINVVRVLVPLVGLAFFIMLIVGSFQMITAGGEPKAVAKSRSTITAAIFGLIVFFGIWFILKLIQAITGVDVTKFAIPS